MKNTAWAALVSLMFANTGFAAGYTGPAAITRIGSMNATGVFEIIGTWTNVDNCANAGKFVVGSHSTDTAQTQSAKYSLLLAAHMSGQTVELYVDGCNADNQPIVRDIWTPDRS